MAVNFRYRKLGYVALNVTDVARTTEFGINTFALEDTGTGPNGEQFLSCGPEHHDLVLYQNKEPGFVRGGWELESPEDVERAHAHFDDLELRPVWLEDEEKEPLGLGCWPAFRVRDPIVGLSFEYFSKMMFRARVRPPLLTNFLHIGHYGINAPNVRDATEFVKEHMGFLPSDILGNYLGTLMRAFPTPNHHSFAFLPSPDGSKKLNHVAFMVESIDDIGRLFNRIEAHGVDRAFGIGRHPTSGSIHLYIFDPDRLIWEYTLGMEQFPEHGAREPRFMSAAPEDYDVWNCRPKPGFGGSGTIVTHDAPRVKIA